MKVKKAKFSLYRYQILPTDRHFQGDLFGDVTSVEELIRRKNEFFGKALEAVQDFEHSGVEIFTKRLLAEDDFFLFQVAANRSLNHETKDFTEQKIDNYPSLMVAVWNHPDKQLIAVQKRSLAFQKTDTVVRMILRSVEKNLEERYLNILHEPLFEEKVFWDIVRRYDGKISSVTFEIITPNMANISASLNQDLKNFAKATNAAKNEIKIESAPDGALLIEAENETINGLVDYSSKGGGDISVKISGLGKKVHTSKTVKEVEVDELELSGPPESVATLMKAILP